MRVGEHLLLRDGGWGLVEELFDTGANEAVFNFRVADYHTYFVGCDDWGFSTWAHNTACTPLEIATYAQKYAQLAKTNGGKFYKAWGKVAPGRTLSAADKKAIREHIRDNLSLFPGVQIKPRNIAGPGGVASTQAQLETVGQQLQARRWTLNNGKGSLRPEEWIPGPKSGTRRGGTAIDLTATKMIGGTPRVLRIQTIDVLADGVTPTMREARNAARIRAAFPNDHLLLIPKVIS